MARSTTLTRKQKNEIRKLLATHEPQIRRAFEASVMNAKAGLDFDEIVRLVSGNDWIRLEQLLRLDQPSLWPLDDAIRNAFIASGSAVTVPRGISGNFSFNGRHPRAEQIIAQIGADLVTKTGSPGAEPIRKLLLQAQQEGVGVQKTARRLVGTVNRASGVREGGIMGLDAPRAARSVRVREILADPDQIADYFNGDKPRFKSTDRRFDARVRKAIKEGKALDKTTADKIVKAHDARLLKARGDTIAKHEAYTAQAQGRREAFAQMSDGGQVEYIEKLWQHNTLNNPRRDHQEQDGIRLPFEEAFVMDDGTRMQYAHDPAGGIKHSANCRCTTTYIPQLRRPA